MFSSRGFMVSYVTFKHSVILKGLILFFARGFPVSQIPFIEETIASLLCILSALVKDQLTISVWIYFWALYFVPFVYVSVFMIVSYCFDYCSSAVQFEIRTCDAFSSLFFFLKIGLIIWGLLCFCIDSRVVSSISLKKCCFMLGIALNLQMALDNLDILTILIL